MNILFVCDPLASFHIEKDSTFTMRREAQKRGHSVWACGTHDLAWQSGQQVSALMQDKGRASLVIAQQAWRHENDGSNTLLCEGTIRIGWVNAAKMKPERIPSTLLELFS